MSRPYISVDTMPPMTNPEWAEWVATNKLNLCYRLESTNDQLTQWVGSFYATNLIGRFQVRRGSLVRRTRKVTTTPARAEWVRP